MFSGAASGPWPSRGRLLLISVVALLLAKNSAPAAEPNRASKPTVGGSRSSSQPEWQIRVREIVAPTNRVLGVGSPLNDSKSRFGWPWLAKRHGIGESATLTRANFRGSDLFFSRLDRDGDGVLGVSDFDWSANAPFVRQQAQAISLFYALNSDGDGVISEKEWLALFRARAGTKGTLTPEDLHKILSPPPGRRTMPSKTSLLLGFLAGDLGSMHEGPNPGQPAPDFTLRTPDGKETVRLSEYRANKPTVLVFGNFT